MKVTQQENIDISIFVNWRWRKPNKILSRQSAFVPRETNHTRSQSESDISMQWRMDLSFSVHIRVLNRINASGLTANWPLPEKRAGERLRRGIKSKLACLHFVGILCSVRLPLGIVYLNKWESPARKQAVRETQTAVVEPNRNPLEEHL